MSSSTFRPTAGASFAAGLLCALLVAGAPSPAHAFWGLLGKAAGKAAGTAGKAGSAAKLAGTAGKTAAAAGAAEGAAGAAARGGAHVAEDAAQLGAHASPSAFSSVNAALPPEVAAYLAKPTASLSAADTAQMMSAYRKMTAQASRSGDFSAVEKLSTSAGSARKLEAPAVAAPAPPVRTVPAPTAAASESASGSGLPWHALRLLTHAAQANNREAQKELARVCAGQTPPRITPEQRAQPEFRQACVRPAGIQAAAAKATAPAAKP